MTDASIKERISKLLAKATGTNNEHEAAAFMAKVDELLDLYQLELWELGDQSDPMGINVVEGLNGASDAWKINLGNSVAAYFGAQMIRTRFRFKQGKHKAMFRVAGRESARVTVEYMLPFIIGQIKQQARTLKDENPGVSEMVLVRRVANALRIRIWKLINDRENTRTAARQERALVVVDELQAFLDAEFANLKTSVTRPVVVHDDARAAAEKISLNRQATGEKQKRIA